jgi:uncharacterized protein (DUF736 family)
VIAIETAMGAARATDEETTMAIIGTFTKSSNGLGFVGTVKTVALNVKARITPVEKDNDKAPDYRIYASTTELGAAWKRTSNAGREYLSVKLDEPFAAVIDSGRNYNFRGGKIGHTVHIVWGGY